jgi:hypothetical protein
VDLGKALHHIEGDMSARIDPDAPVRAVVALCVVDVPDGQPNVYVQLRAAPDGKPTAGDVQDAGEVLMEAGMAMHQNPDRWVSAVPSRYG